MKKAPLWPVACYLARINEEVSMSVSKKRAERCVTHHYGCDCREYRFAQMELALQIIRTWASCDKTSPDSREKAMANIVTQCNKGLSPFCDVID